MSTPPPPATAPPAAADVPQTQATVALPTSFAAVGGVLLMIPALILFAFHLGAGYLSYQKYGNLGWAFLNFIFAYFYYPYYSFFLAKDPGPSMGMIGGKKGLGGFMKAVEKMMK